jgi:hypothetical protein
MRDLQHPVRLVVAVTALLAVTACATQRFDGPDGDRLFYEARCGVCHVPYAREQFAPAEWPSILDEMAPRAGLTKSQRERVRSYLTAR